MLKPFNDSLTKKRKRQLSLDEKIVNGTLVFIVLATTFMLYDAHTKITAQQQQQGQQQECADACDVHVPSVAHTAKVSPPNYVTAWLGTVCTCTPTKPLP